jgi:amphi-Trp domain-containing protein
MAKKDRAKARAKSERTKYELTMSTNAVAAYLEELASSLRKGAVTLGEPADSFETAVDGDVDLAVQARHGKRRSRIELSLAFRAGNGVKAPTNDAQSSDEEPVATIPDEMSF